MINHQTSYSTYRKNYGKYMIYTAKQIAHITNYMAIDSPVKLPPQRVNQSSATSGISVQCVDAWWTKCHVYSSYIAAVAQEV